MDVETARRLFEQFLADPAPAAMQAVIEANPALLTPEIDAPVAYLIDAALRDGDEFRRLQLENAAQMLHALRALGPNAAFAALRGEKPPSADDADAGMGYWQRYRETGDLGMLEAAVERWQEYLDSLDSSSPDYAAALTSLASGLSERYQRTQNPDDVRRAVELGEEAVRITPATAPQRATRVANWAGALLNSYGATNDMGNLDAALTALRKAAASATEAEERAVCLHNLSSGIYLRYQRLQRPEDIDAMIDASREACNLSTSGTAAYAERQNGLAIALELRFLDRGDKRSLKKAIRAWDEAVFNGAPSAPLQANILFARGRAIWRRHRIEPSAKNRAAAVQMLSLAYMYGRSDAEPLLLELFTAGGDEHTPELLEFFDRVRSEYARYQQTGHYALLEAAGRGWRLALKHPAVSREHPVERAATLVEAGFVFHAQGQVTGELAHIDAAVEAFEEAVELTAPDSPNLSGRRNNLAQTLSLGYDRTGRRADLERARDMFEEILVDGPPEILRSGIKANLARVLVRLAQNRPDTRPLVRAVELLDEAVQALPKDSGERGDLVLTRTAARIELYDRTQASSDLDRAQSDLEYLLEELGDFTERPRTLSLLASILEKQYDRSGDVSSLIEAVGNVEQAVDIVHGELAEAAMLEQLGILRTRLAQATGRFTEADRAVDALTASLSATPEDSPLWPTRLVLLAEAKLQRARLRNDDEGRAEALDDFRTALSRLPEGSAEHLSVASALAEEVGEAPAYLDGAIEGLRQIGPGLPQASETLGRHLFRRYLRDGETEDLDAAIEALSGTDSTALALALARRHEIGGAPEDRDRAVEILRRESDDVNPRVALAAARVWAELELKGQGVRAAADAYRAGVRAIARIMHEPGLRAEREEWLRDARGFVAEAALGLALAGDPRHAVEALERDRALLLSEVLQRRRFDLAALRAAGYGEVAERFEWAARRLEALEDADVAADSAIPAHSGPARSAAADRLVGARTALDAVVREIDAIPDFEGVFDAPEYDAILELTGGRTVVFVAPGDPFGVALTVDERGRTPALFQYLTDDRVQAGVNAYLAMYTNRHERPDRWRGQLDHTLRWIWGSVMAQLLSDPFYPLGQNGEVVLVPCGLLSLLPLHAAWVADEQRPSGRRYALDDFRMTYAPNVRVLAESRRRRDAAGPARLLVVDEPSPVSAPPLGGAQAEASAAARAFEGATVLRGARATRDEVLAQLPSHSIAHFACHGRAEVEDPLDSFLLLAEDERLSVRDLMTTDIHSLRLAVLSACETASVGRDLPDEVIGLPAALLQAGAAGVVASSWAVPDVSTALLLTRFYELWGADGEPAEALRSAQQWMRDTTNGEKLSAMPDLMQPLSDRVPERALALWERARGHGHPYHWAAFSFVGA